MSGNDEKYFSASACTREWQKITIFKQCEEAEVARAQMVSEIGYFILPSELQLIASRRKGDANPILINDERLASAGV